MNRNADFDSGVAARGAAHAARDYANPYPVTTDNKGEKHFGANLMLGNQPSGATSATVNSLGDVSVYKGRQNIGTLKESRGSIDHVETQSDFRRKGVATSMLRMANFARGRSGQDAPLKHSETRTKLGDAWAKTVGGETPKIKPSIGFDKSSLENI